MDAGLRQFQEPQHRVKIRQQLAYPYSSTGSCSASKKNGNQDNPSLSAMKLYLRETCEIKADLHAGIIRAFESIHGKGNVRVEHLKEFGKDGMKALAESVKGEAEALRLKRKSSIGSWPLMFHVPHHSTKFKVEWSIGNSLLDVAKSNEDLLGEYMEGTCGGNMSCCTCHIYLEEPYWGSLLEPPSEAELDMLDLAYEPKEQQSRLGCQVVLKPEMIERIKGKHDTFDVTIPPGVNNVWN